LLSDFFLNFGPDDSNSTATVFSNGSNIGKAEGETAANVLVGLWRDLSQGRRETLKFVRVT
jgi:hypothetical protein